MSLLLLVEERKNWGPGFLGRGRSRSEPLVPHVSCGAGALQVLCRCPGSEVSIHSLSVFIDVEAVF